nr:MAG TPA: LysM [Caudoviricetes sp.]
MLKKAIIVCSIATVAAASFLVYDFVTAPQTPPARDVVTYHVVQSGDTLWEIAGHYMDYETGSNRGILDFEEGILSENPGLEGGRLIPGQVIKIRYKVK